jgi:hypothetical protein
VDPLDYGGAKNDDRHDHERTQEHYAQDEFPHNDYASDKESQHRSKREDECMEQILIGTVEPITHFFFIAVSYPS